jgi:hypothetical protein
MAPTAIRYRRRYHVHGRSVISSEEDYVRFHDESVVSGSSSPFAQDIVTSTEAATVFGFSNVEFSLDSYGRQDSATIYQDGIPGGSDERVFTPESGTVAETARPAGVDDYFVIDAAVTPGTAVPSSAQTYEGVVASTAVSTAVPSGTGTVDSVISQTATGIGVPSAVDSHTTVDAGTVAATASGSSTEEFTRSSLNISAATGMPSSVNIKNSVDAAVVTAVGVPAVVYDDQPVLIGTGSIDTADNYNRANDASDTITGTAVPSALEIPAFDFGTVSGLAIMSSVVAFGRADQDLIVGTAAPSSANTVDHIESSVSTGTAVPSSTDHADYVDSGTSGNTATPIGTLDLQGYDIGIYNFSIYDYGPGSGEAGVIIGVATGNISGSDVYQPSASGTFISAAEQYNAGAVTNSGPDLVDRFAMSFREWYNNQLVARTGVPSAAETYIPGGGGPGGSFVIGAPANWAKLISAGGHRPSLTAYVQEPGITFGPDIAYYNNAAARTKKRASTIRNDLVYYPRSLGIDITAIQGGTNFAVTLAKAVTLAPGTTVVIKNLTGKAAKGQTLTPNPNGTYTVKTSSGTSMVFNESWNGTGVYDTSQPGYIAWQSRNDTVYEVLVTPGNVSTLVDSTDGTPLFTLSGGYWTWNGGMCHRFLIAGTTPNDSSFKLRFPSNFDVVNPAPGWAASGVDADAQLLNPFTCFDIQNCTIDFQGGGVLGSQGGAAAYSPSLGGVYIPNGPGCRFAGVTGTIKGLLNYGYSYDGNKVGSGCVNLKWQNCFNYRNTTIPTGSHTDGYQITDLDNRGLGTTVPTFENVFMQSGGNSMFYLNDAQGSASAIIANVWARYCIAWTGNKFADWAGCQDSGARLCWINHGYSTVNLVQPRALDFGSGDPNHTFPRNTIIWPNDASANLLVDAAGATSVAPRVTLPLTYTDTNGNVTTSTFSYVN